MRKIKIFTGCDHVEVEEETNKWLADHRTAIIHRTMQSECCLVEGAWSLTITIFYYEGKQDA